VKLRRYNVLLIVVDTLRKDHSEPLWDILKEKGFIRYDNVYSTSSWTVPSHASIFTGLYPCFHGAHETAERKGLDVILERHHETITSVLKKNGYETLLYTANPHIMPKYGFDDFDRFEEIDYIPVKWTNPDKETAFVKELGKKVKHKNAITRILTKFSNPRYIRYQLRSVIRSIYLIHHEKKSGWPLMKGGREIIKRSLLALEQRSGKNPFFMFLNLMEMHNPYYMGEEGNLPLYWSFLKNGPLDPDMDRSRTAYENEVGISVELIKSLLRDMEKVMKNTLMIIASDHGQLFGENGRYNHGTFLENELLEVPLFVRYPFEGMKKENKGIISLVNIKKFVEDIVLKGSRSDSSLYSETVFSETYGIHQEIGLHMEKLDQEKVNDADRWKILIRTGKLAGLFVVDEEKFERIRKIDGTVVEEEIVEMFLRSGIDRFINMRTGRIFKEIAEKGNIQ